MIAVTGANGLLGSFIVRKLHSEGVPFVAIKRKGSDLSTLADIADQITWRDAEVTDSIALTEALQGTSGVIHTAALVSFNPRKKKELFEINIGGTRNVVDACLHNGVGRLLHISSVAALGRQRGQSHIDESNKWVDNPLNTPYGKSKYLAELEVFRGQMEGLNTVCINPSVILAPANWNNSSARLFKYVWEQRRFYMQGNMNYVDVRDVVNAAYGLYNSEVSNTRFIVSAGNITFKDFFDRLATRFERKAPSIMLNKSMISMLAGVEYARSVLTGADPLITKETARLAETQFFFDNAKIKKALEIEFQTIDSTLDWCCEYYLTLNRAKNE